MSPSNSKRRGKGKSAAPPIGVTQIYVGNRIFKVTEIKDGSIADSLGEVVFTLGRIDLAPHQTPDCLADTLLHEVIHAIDFVFGANGTYLTEEQVVRLTGGLLTVLNDPRNTGFLQALTTIER